METGHWEKLRNPKPSQQRQVVAFGGLFEVFEAFFQPQLVWDAVICVATVIRLHKDLSGAFLIFRVWFGFFFRHKGSSTKSDLGLLKSGF